MSLFGKNNMEPMCSINNTERKHKPQVLFRTKYGIVSIIDPDSIGKFQLRSGFLMVDKRIGPMTRATILKSLLDPSDEEALNKALPIRAKRGSGLSAQEAEVLVERLIRESGSF